MKRRLGLLSIVLVGLGWISVIQGPGANQNAHLALVTSLASRTPRVDRFHNWTGDVSYIDGHYYADKAPGLALVTLPWYLALDVLDLRTRGPSAHVPWPAAQNDMPATALWEVGLVGATLPAIVLLLLVRSVAERLVPGYGTAAALVVGTGCLLAVLATMFFAHVLSTCLGFAAFAVLFHARRGPPRLGPVAAAGLLAGFAVVVEFPLAIVAAVVGLYAVLGTRPVRRAAAYAGGLVVGIAPLLAFNAWAFGSPTTLAYTNAIIQPGSNGHAVVGANASGFFGVGVPSLRAGVELLFAGHGLLVLSPVLALAAVGVVSLARSGHRAEAAVVVGVAVCFLLYNAAYYLPFGGFAAGPRFLVPAVPFLAIGVAAAWRSSPVLTVTLFLASVVVATVSLIGNPQGESESAGSWFNRVERGDVTRTVFDWISGSHETVAVVPVVLLFAAAVAIGLAVTPRFRVDARVMGVALAALVAWRIVYTGANVMFNVDAQTGGWAGLAGVLGLAVAIPLAFLTARTRAAAVLPALLLVPIAWPPFAAHTGLTLTAITIAAGGIVLVRWLPPPVGRRLLGRHSSN